MTTKTAVCLCYGCWKDSVSAMECILRPHLHTLSEDIVHRMPRVSSSSTRLVFWLANIREVRVVWRNRRLGLILWLTILLLQEYLWCFSMLRHTLNILLRSSKCATILYDDVSVNWNEEIVEIYSVTVCIVNLIISCHCCLNFQRSCWVPSWTLSDAG